MKLSVESIDVSKNRDDFYDFIFLSCSLIIANYYCYSNTDNHFVTLVVLLIHSASAGSKGVPSAFNTS